MVTMIYVPGHPLITLRLALESFTTWLHRASLTELRHTVEDIEDDTERRVVTLRKVYGRSHREIALHLGMSLVEVERYLVRAARHISEDSKMLILTRRVDESLHIGDDVVVTVMGIKGTQCRLGISAPREIQVDRHEVWERKQRERA